MSLSPYAGRRLELGLGLIGLQLEIGLIEQGQRLAGLDGVTDLDQALGDLAGNPEAKIGLDPRLDGADKGPVGGLVGVVNGSHQHRTHRGLRRRFGAGVTACQQR